jgi:FdhD protein
MVLPQCRIPTAVWRTHGIARGERTIPEETALALTFNGTAYAVMMATPQDLEDFAVGFALHEGIIAAPEEIRQLEIVEQDGSGIELRLWLADAPAAALGERRRRIAGPSGCGLCGMESLAETVRPVPRVEAATTFTAAEIMDGLDRLPPLQTLNRETRAVHAAAFYVPECGVLALREDVGRHNALDKLGGALTLSGTPGRSGMVLLTSRISVEMVQKAAIIGTPLVVAVSAPTMLAVRTAEAAGITLVGVARQDGFEIFTHRHRVVSEAAIDVA